MYSGDGVHGKLVGFAGEADPFFQLAARLPCEDLRGPCLKPDTVAYMFNCFLRRPPAGVSQPVFDDYCRKMSDCGFFRQTGCEPEVSQRLGTHLPLPDCLGERERAILRYCEEHGHSGVDPQMNAACWALQTAPNYAQQFRRRPPCADAVECLSEADASRVVNCLRGDCAMPPEWVDAMAQKPLCPDTDFGTAPLPDCLSPEDVAQIEYCRQYGYVGPERDRNALCFAGQKLGLLAELERIPKCSTSAPDAAREADARRVAERVSTAAREARARREAERMSADAAKEAEARRVAERVSAPTQAPPPASAPPVPNEAWEPTTLAPEPDAPPKKTSELSATTWGLIAVGGVLAVGGLVWALGKGE